MQFPFTRFYAKTHSCCKEALSRKLADSETDWRLRSEPVPGWEFHPLKSSTFSGRTVLTVSNSRFARGKLSV
jgi:hypothetical protein